MMDSLSVFVTDAEMKLYCLETFRTFNAAAWFSRDRGVFTTTANTTFYDLPSTLFGGSVSLNANPPVQSFMLAFTLKDQDLLQDIQAALMEPLSPSSWIGSEQFTLQDVSDSLQKTRNQFLFDTGLLLTHGSVTPAPPGNGIFGLLDTTIHVRRAAFQPNFPANAFFKPLSRDDEQSANGFAAGWSVNPDQPTAYSTIMVPKVRIQLMPINALNGSIDLLSVIAPTPVNLPSGVLMGIPDDLCWIVKWGTLADLLSKDGEAHDPARSAYCQARYEQGVALAKLWNTIQQPVINGVPVLMNSIEDADRYNPTWQGPTGVPNMLLTCAPNLIALSPTPDTGGPYGVQLDVVRNFPIPLADTDFIQVGREQIGPLVDYTIHLASFKEGLASVQDTQPLLDDFMEMAMYYNHTLAQTAPQLFRISFDSRKMAEEKPIATTEGMQAQAAA